MASTVTNIPAVDRETHGGTKARDVSSPRLSGTIQPSDHHCAFPAPLRTDSPQTAFPPGQLSNGHPGSSFVSKSAFAHSSIEHASRSKLQITRRRTTPY